MTSIHSPSSLIDLFNIRQAGRQALSAMTYPLVRIATALRHRREIETLLKAEAGILRDLGLQPSDISSALAEPLWRDPSTHLLASSLERRVAKRAAAHDNLFCLGQVCNIEHS